MVKREAQLVCAHKRDLVLDSQTNKKEKKMDLFVECRRSFRLGQWFDCFCALSPRSPDSAVHASQTHGRCIMLHVLLQIELPNSSTH
jgi:hypothetical protein